MECSVYDLTASFFLSLLFSIRSWFHVKVVVCSSEGFGRVYIDDMRKPSLVFALKFNNGCVGFFQYEQKGYFKNLVVKALDVEKEEED